MITISSFVQVWVFCALISLVQQCCSQVDKDPLNDSEAYIENEKLNLSDGDRIDTDQFMEWVIRRIEAKPESRPKTKSSRKDKSGKSQQLYLELAHLEHGCTIRRQIFAVIDQGNHKTRAQLWAVNSRACFESPRRIEWRTLIKIAEAEVIIGPAVFGNLEFYINRKSSPDQKVKEIKTSLNDALHLITRTVKELLAKEGVDQYFSEVPVLFRSSPARDVPTVTRETLMYAVRRAINDYVDETKINLFTTPQLAAARSGIIEALHSFHAINFHRLPELVNATDQNDDVLSKTRLYKILDGVLDIDHSTVQIAFPVPLPIKDGPIRTVDVRMEHPTIPPHQISVFATSFVNYGVTRALAFLLKAYCHRQLSPDGICVFPCFHPDWRQECRIGKFKLPDNVSPEGIVVPTDNTLLRPAGFCNTDRNPSIQLARVRESCDEAFLNTTIGEDSERMAIPGCKEIRGSGDFQACSAIIGPNIIRHQLPANQDAIFVGATIPNEVGASEQFNLLTRLRIVGGNINRIVYYLRERGWLSKESNVLLNDIISLLDDVCQMKADIKGRLLTSQPNAKNHAISIPLTSESAYSCFRLTYIVRLLNGFGISPLKSGDLVRFDDFQHRKTLEEKDAVKLSCPTLKPPSLNSKNPTLSLDLSDSNINSYPESSIPKCNRPGIEVSQDLHEVFSPVQRPFEKCAGMILSQIFSNDLVKNIFILGAAHWKNNAFMSPVDDAIREYKKAHRNITEQSEPGAPQNKPTPIKPTPAAEPLVTKSTINISINATPKH